MMTVCEGDTVFIDGAAFRMKELLYQGFDSRIFSASSLECGGADPAFAVKCCLCRRGSDGWDKAMREIEAGNILRKCPHITRLHGYSVLSDSEGICHNVFLLFGYMRCLDEMTVDTQVALEMCRDISLALGELSGKGLMHGDVKPSNIFFDGEKWQLGDLGSVCLSGQSPVYCTEGYASPEAMREEACDIRSDIYSLGISLYRILSGGRLPFCPVPCEEMNESDVYETIERRLNGEEIPPIKDVSEGLNEMILRMCRFRRRDRFRNPSQTARTAAKLLKKTDPTDNASNF